MVCAARADHVVASGADEIGLWCRTDTDLVGWTGAQMVTFKAGGFVEE
jgi:hypothetical protein